MEVVLQENAAQIHYLSNVIRSGRVQAGTPEWIVHSFAGAWPRVLAIGSCPHTSSHGSCPALQ